MAEAFTSYFKTVVENLGIKRALSGLRPFFATENPLKMIKIAFYFGLKALLFLKMFTFLS